MPIPDRARAQQLAQEFQKRGDPTGWFEALYTEAHGNTSVVPWAELKSNSHLVSWLDQHKIQGNWRRALVVGCGLGDDAEELARRGFQVIAFDIAPTAIQWCKQRFPQSTVEYLVADALHPPSDWVHSFDFIFEAYTLQALPPNVRQQAIRSIATLVGNQGTLLVVCRARTPEETPSELPPWPLTKTELNTFLQQGLHEIASEDYFDIDDPSARLFRIQYQR